MFLGLSILERRQAKLLYLWLVKAMVQGITDTDIFFDDHADMDTDSW